MADAKMTLNSTIQAIVDAYEETVYSYVASNNGQTLDEIVIGTTLGAVIVENLLRIQMQQGLLRGVVDTSGQVKWYTAGSWASLLINNLAAARTWVASNDGGLVSEMAVALSVTSEVALALGRMMENEKRLTVVGVSVE